MIRRAGAIWVGIASILTFVYWFASLKNPFSGELHSWASAHMALLAHSFAQFGVLNLHGLPLQNYLPLGSQPDSYNHWPPLYPILLSFFFNLFGESALVIHSFVILVDLIYWAALFFLVKRCFDQNVALWTIFVCMTIPSYMIFSRLVWTPNAVMGAVCVALYCYLRGTEGELKWKWIASGSVAVLTGVLLGWEAASLGFVLFIAGMWNRARPRQIAAAIYAATGLAAVAFIIAIYFAASSELRYDLWHTIGKYMGSASSQAEIPIHGWAQYANPTPHITLFGWVMNMSLNWSYLLGGSLGVIATSGVLMWLWMNRKNLPQAYFALVGLLGIVLVWCALFPLHVYLHEYQSLIALPVVCISLALCIKFATVKLPEKLKVVALVILPLLMIVPLIERASRAFVPLPPDAMIQYAMEIEANTSETSIILSPEVNMVPVYYSHRHVIRGIVNDDTLSKAFPEAEMVFPGSDLYLAVPNESLQNFPCAVYRLPLVRQTQTMVLFKVIPGDCR